MASPGLRVALIAGGMYDGLYERIPEFERSTGNAVAVAFRGTHPELNAHLAVADTAAYDVVSTHTKYAPSQQRLLAPLEGFDTSDFFPPLLDLASVGGALYGLPRNLDLRLLHYRADLLPSPPATWDELVPLARQLTHAPDLYGFVYAGTGPGLFATFLELAEAAGARVFPESLLPEVDNEGGRWALGVLRSLYASGSVPEAVRGWHYDEVHQFFRQGRAAMTADWPGYFGSYRAVGSPVRDRFRLSRLPAGPAGHRRCCAGSHTFALTHAGARKEEARALLGFLTASEQQALEARQGSVPVRRSVMNERQRAAVGQDAERLALLKLSMECDLVIPPRYAAYPEVEEILWRTVQSAMFGEMAIGDALAAIERRVRECMAHVV